MDADSLVALLRGAIPDVPFEHVPSIDLHTTVYVERDHVPVLMPQLRDAPSLQFELLAELTAADFWPREPRFEVVYILVSIARRQRLRVQVRLHGEDAHVADVSSVWPAANWLEREVWDLFGIAFDGHSDPR